MTCYFCGRSITLDCELTEATKPIELGWGKYLHSSCVIGYREYLKEIVDYMSGRRSSVPAKGEVH